MIMQTLLPIVGVQDFVRQIQQYVRPSRGREMLAEVIVGAWDWKTYLEPLMVSVAGLAIVKGQKTVNHAFHMIRREHIINFNNCDKWTVSSCFEDCWVNKHGGVVDVGDL